MATKKLKRNGMREKKMSYLKGLVDKNNCLTKKIDDTSADKSGDKNVCMTKK